MTIREQLDLLGRCLNKAMQEVKGRAYPAGDVPHILDELRTKPGAPSCGVMFWSEEPVGDYTELGKVLREFHLVISRGKGMKLVSGESITQGAGGGPPMADLVELARDTSLAIRLEDEQGELRIPVYRGTGPFQVEGLLLDAFEIKVALFGQNVVQGGPEEDQGGQL